MKTPNKSSRGQAGHYVQKEKALPRDLWLAKMADKARLKSEVSNAVPASQKDAGVAPPKQGA